MRVRACFEEEAVEEATEESTAIMPATSLSFGPSPMNRQIIL